MTLSSSVTRMLLENAVFLDHDLIDSKAGPVFEENKVRNCCLEHEVHTAFFEPLMKWADHRIVLVVHGAHNAGKRIESGNHVGEAHEIAFELNCAMPGLKRKGSTPHVPEVSLKEIRRKLVGDHGPSKQFLRLHRQTLEC